MRLYLCLAQTMFWVCRNETPEIATGFALAKTFHEIPLKIYFYT
jgi:hypothetical protein